ncbi:hypothetical protein ACFX12_023452 [Malus domestica]
MSNLELAVEVVSAHNLMPRHGQGTTSAYVEVLFDGKRAQTSTKVGDVNPVWNETFFFDVSNPNRLRDLVVEANVFHNGNANSTSFLGKVCLPGTSFVRYSQAVVSPYSLKKRGVFSFSRVRGELALKAYLADPNQSQPSVNDEAKSESPEPPKVAPNNSGSSSRPCDYPLKETRPYLVGGEVVRGRFVRGDSPVISTHELVEAMHYLFVRVVKALDLSCRDAYVEVKVGNYKGITRSLEKKQNPEWNEFDFDKVQTRVPVAPERHQLVDKDGKKKGELMLAVWYGTQADEAFPNAWYSDIILPDDMSSAAYTHVRSKVYDSPRLWYVRVKVIEARDLVVPDTSRIPDAYASIQIGHQCLKTKEVQSLNPMWNEELMFVTAEPFDDQHLIVSVEDHVCPDKEETLGRVSIALNSVKRCGESADDDQIICGQWFNLDMSLSNAMEKDRDHKFSSRIHLHVCLYGGYHLLDDSSNYCNDLQRPVGVLELGVLNAKDLMPMKTETGKATTDSYCVAKFGDKWVRTRTITNSPSPKYSEQYTWEVYDPVSVLTVGVFDNRQIGNSSGKKDKEIGKVRIRISTLESDRVYTHLYPLLSLSPSGVKKTGELHLAIRFSRISLANLMLIYFQPVSVKVQPGTLRDQAVLVVADRLAQVEPPLGKEVVEYMYSDAADVHFWSLRRSKANFFRMMGVLSWFISVLKWFDEVCAWRSSIITVLVHVLFVMLVCTPELILSTVFLYMFLTGISNLRYRPRHPLHVDTRLSHADAAHPDELDEEFDTFPTSQNDEIIEMRYDRLRSIAGRIQTVVGDIATMGERIQEFLISWRDPRATFIFITFCLFVAILLFVTPLKVVVIVGGFYLMRHPRLRRRKQMPSILANFYRRLPEKSEFIF